jgi:hypothetical protein
MAEIGCLL